MGLFERIFSKSFAMLIVVWLLDVVSLFALNNMLFSIICKHSKVNIKITLRVSLLFLYQYRLPFFTTEKKSFVHSQFMLNYCSKYFFCLEKSA